MTVVQVVLYEKAQTQLRPSDLTAIYYLIF